MKQVLTLIALLSLVLTIDCNAEPAESVAWYKAHDTERKAVLEKCRQDMSRAVKSESCLNADRAEDQKTRARRGWAKPAPIDLNRKGA